jgi:hypothetical protein
MPLKVIGAGFGRTGTHTLKHALEMVGFGPCYHMVELMQHPHYVPAWQAAAEGERVDWDAIFSNYPATVDWPALYFWRELSAHYPDAKVLLSVRDPESWYESFYKTIYTALTSPPPNNLPFPPRQIMGQKLILEKTFAGRFDDRSHAIAVYQRHNEEVQRTIPPHRLLVYEMSAGWEPLCNFLQCPIPQEPFPKTNSVEEFQARLAAQRAAAAQAAGTDRAADQQENSG